ncbi:hypothetical protein [Actinomadura coerulea]|uniref:hypothetical protein n=1 Tax=Actinomadura coerulea TaxID=46159 RepID=UPI003448BB79
MIEKNAGRHGSRISDDRENWMPEDDEAMGTESFDGDPEKFANVILINRLSDLEAEGGAVGYIRVVVWEGDRQRYIGAAAVVVEPEESYKEVLRARREQGA